MRVMLKDSGLLNEFWPEAVESDVYLRNRTAIGPEFDGQVVSPIEAYTGQQPSASQNSTLKYWQSSN
jgi:hypothetical protein